MQKWRKREKEQQGNVFNITEELSYIKETEMPILFFSLYIIAVYSIVLVGLVVYRLITGNWSFYYDENGK